MSTEVLLLFITLSLFMVLMCYACVAINPREDDDYEPLHQLQETDLPDPLQTESGLGAASEKDKPTS